MLILTRINPIMTTTAAIGAMLHEARTTRRLPKTRLAAMANVSRNTLQQLEAGLGNVELKTLLAVCDALGLDIVFAPKEVSAKVQVPFQVRAYPAYQSPSRFDQSGMPTQTKRSSTYLSRLIQDKELSATGKVSAQLASAPADSRKDKK